MKDFIFPDRLEQELNLFLDDPSKIPNILCFYGVPAQGKTSFAKFLGDQVACEVVYLDAVSHTGDGVSSASVVQDLTASLRTHSLFSDGIKTFEKCFIVDEFHNFSDQRQDSFKIIFDRVLKPVSLRHLIIICVNTDDKNSIRKILTPAIYSRCHKIRFDILASEKSEVINKAISRLPDVDPDLIRRNLPDWRDLERAILIS